MKNICGGCFYLSNIYDKAFLMDPIKYLYAWCGPKYTLSARRNKEYRAVKNGINSLLIISVISKHYKDRHYCSHMFHKKLLLKISRKEHNVCARHCKKYRNFTWFPGVETVPFRKICTPGNQVKLRYFSQWESTFNKVTGPDYADVKNDEKNHDNDDLLPILQTNTETNNVKKIVQILIFSKYKQYFLFIRKLNYSSFNIIHIIIIIIIIIIFIYSWHK